MLRMREVVRQFGLEYCELPDILSNVSALLRVLTLNIDSRNKKPIPTIFYILTTIAWGSYVYVYIVSGVWFPFWHCYHTGDLLSALVVFSLNCTSEVGAVKLFYMICYEKEFKSLIDKCLDSDSHVVKGSRFSQNMRKALGDVKRRAIIYWWVLVINGALYVIKPIVTPGQHLPMDTFILLGLEPMFESPNYEIATTVTAIAVMFICYTVASVAAFFILIVGYIEAQMLSLSEEMTSLWKDANDNYQETINELKTLKLVDYEVFENVIESDDIINKHIKKQLVDIIAKHSVNVSLLKEIEEVMRGPNALGFLFLIVGLIAELLGGLKNTILQVPFTLIQVGVDCYLGQKVMDANVKFERAVYDCRWENFDQTNKKIVLLMLQNSQKTMTLTAGGMATLSFGYFMNIIKSTYSAYNTLGSII